MLILNSEREADGGDPFLVQRPAESGRTIRASHARVAILEAQTDPGEVLTSLSELAGGLFREARTYLCAHTTGKKPDAFGETDLPGAAIDGRRARGADRGRGMGRRGLARAALRGAVHRAIARRAVVEVVPAARETDRGLAAEVPAERVGAALLVAGAQRHTTSDHVRARVERDAAGAGRAGRRALLHRAVAIPEVRGLLLSPTREAGGWVAVIVDGAGRAYGRYTSVSRPRVRQRPRVGPRCGTRGRPVVASKADLAGRAPGVITAPDWVGAEVPAAPFEAREALGTITGLGARSGRSRIVEHERRVWIARRDRAGVARVARLGIKGAHVDGR